MGMHVRHSIGVSAAKIGLAFESISHPRPTHGLHGVFSRTCSNGLHVYMTGTRGIASLFVQCVRSRLYTGTSWKFSNSLATTVTDRPASFANMGNVQPPEAKRQKLTGRAFYESIGSPKLILAPMVDQSEFVGIQLLPRSLGEG